MTPHTTPLPVAVVANLPVFAAVVCAAALHHQAPGAYEAAIQEDGYVEWATFWSFALASVLAAVGALRQQRVTGQIPWYLAGVAGACAVLALEEISWGQRVFGFGAPDYLLEANAQQEFNLHNTVSSTYRSGAFLAVTVFYGLLIPVLALSGRLRQLMERSAVVVTPLATAPAFAVIAVAHVAQPLRYVDEWLELILGLAFACSVWIMARRYHPAPDVASSLRLTVQLALVGILSVVTVTASGYLMRASADELAAVHTEMAALTRDFLSGRLRTDCGLNARVRSYVSRYGQDYLHAGEYHTLTGSGLPPTRAEHFLDPWNSPYWIRHQCSEDGSVEHVYVYSMGANRRRDTSGWTLGGDDVIAHVSRWGHQPER